MNLIKVAKKIGDVIYILALLLVIIVTSMTYLTISNTPFKYKAFLVQSGSMEPAIKTGSIIFVAPQTDYKTGDVITFYNVTKEGGKKDIRSTATHRIVLINESDSKIQYQTQGDANSSPDPQPVQKENVIGKYLLAIPFIGYLIAFAKTQVGFIVLIAFPVCVILYTEFLNIKKEILRLLTKRKNNKIDDLREDLGGEEKK